MKLYIPFNSNDFNSVFSTLSISPASFYQQRNYSFKRSCPTVLNPYESSLLAYEKPVMPTSEFDKEDGFPLVLGVDLDVDNAVRVEATEGVGAFKITGTIYLTDDFELIFRVPKEKEETFSKSLKSIETKYAHLAKTKSRILRKDEGLFLGTEPAFPKDSTTQEIPTQTFTYERELNKAQGVILGFAVGNVRNLSPELNRLQILDKELNNLISLYINSLSTGKSGEVKERVFHCLREIEDQFSRRETLEESLLFDSKGLTSGDIHTDKAQNYLGFNKFELIIEGLLSKDSGNLPFILKVVKARRAVQSRYNSKYPDSHIRKVNGAVNAVRNDLDRVVVKEKQVSNKIDSSSLPRIERKNKSWHVTLPSDIGGGEGDLLVSTLQFFIEKDDLTHPDDLFRYRKELLIELGRVLKRDVAGWDEGVERKYLRNLLDSFDSLRAEFKISQTNSDTMRSIGLLFTKGRDFMKYVEGLPAAEIEKYQVPLSIWGAAYGAAVLPKTITEDILDKGDSSTIVFAAFKNVIKSLEPNDYIKLTLPISLGGRVAEPREPYGLVEEPKESEKEEVVDDDLLQRLLAHKKFKGKDEFLQVVEGVLQAIKSSSVDEGLFMSPEVKVEDFDKMLREKIKGVKGFGPKTADIVVDLYKQSLMNGRNEK